MRSDDLETRMRRFETALDTSIPLGFQIVARLDGRSFTRLTHELCDFEAPFDRRFHELMATTCRHLMGCGFNVLLAYSESDEISLLFHPEEGSFGRKPRKWISVLAGEASGAFSLGLGRAAAFDARLSVLPGPEQVVDYFRWRMNDAARCCLNGHAYWMLRGQGLSASSATQRLQGISRVEKHELLFGNGINFDALPAWQKRGFGVYWLGREIVGRNPVTDQPTRSHRRILHTDLDLPWKDDYAAAVRGLIAGRPFRDPAGSAGNDEADPLAAQSSGDRGSESLGRGD